MPWSGNLKANLALGIGLMLTALLLVVPLWMKTAGPAAIEKATIVELANNPGSEGRSAVVEIRLANGAQRRLTAPRRVLARCAIGDDVEVVQRQFVYEIGPRACALAD